MNILKNLLFSFKGKIGRADFIYGITYAILLFLVSIDAFINPGAVFLIGGGVDFIQILIYTASLIGLGAFIWSYMAVTQKRLRAQDIEIRWAFL